MNAAAERNVFFLDDDAERIIEFRNAKHKDIAITFATTPHLAIYRLEESITSTPKDFVDVSMFNEIWLDHDLGVICKDNLDNPNRIITNMTDVVEINSKPVVKWIIENKRAFVYSKIIIHSWNYYAANEMFLLFKDAGMESQVEVKPFEFEPKKIQ